jgi:hypothetical protein
MVAGLAKGDWLELQAEGLNPSLEDFDRLNQLALRLTDGAETTCANFPRVGWAGDIPFYQPTIQAYVWYHTHAVRMAANEETEFTLWAYALAHARTPNFFNGLDNPDAINADVSDWAARLPVSRDEVLRACRYAAVGFDDAHPAEPDGMQDVRRRGDRNAAAANLATLESRLAKACAVMKVAPSELMTETPSRLDMICEAAAVELGKELVKDEAQLRADYDLTLREIRRRLKKASEKNGNGKNDKDADPKT